MESNAERLARTQYVKANTAVNQELLDNDPDVIGYQLYLSSYHNVVDICDFFTSADLYGMGAGVRPRTVAIPLPLHPNCYCKFRLIYRGEIKTIYNKDAAVTWLRSNPKVTKEMMNKSNYIEFKKSSKDWESKLYDYVNPDKVKKMNSIRKFVA